MKFDADTISDMPRLARTISTGSSKRSDFSSAKNRCASSTQAADDHRITALVKRAKLSITKAPWNAVPSPMTIET